MERLQDCGAKMRICVVGWYLYPEFYDILSVVHCKYPVTIVSHVKGVTSSLPVIEIPNIGLEWGVYSHYLQNIWDGDSVLFTHDDNKIFDVTVFDEIASIKKDCSMIFRTEKEKRCNIGVHGRALFCSERFLKFYKDYICSCKFSKGTHKGFWYDQNNLGFTLDGGNGDKNEDINRGTHHMKAVMEKLSKETDFDFSPTIVGRFMYGYRGKIGLEGLREEINNEKYKVPGNYSYTL